MALPGPGNSLSINQIRNELGTSSGSLRALSALAGKSTPDAISEFYGYGTTTTTTTTQAPSCTSYLVGYSSSSANTACINFSNGNVITVGINTSDWLTATFLYRSCGILTARAVGWYSADGRNRYWNGSAFTSSSVCVF